MAKNIISYTTFKGIAKEERDSVLKTLKVPAEVIAQYTEKEKNELEAKAVALAKLQAKREENIKKNNKTFTIDGELNTVKSIKVLESKEFGLAVVFAKSLDGNANYIARSVSAKDCTLVHGAITAKKCTNHQKRLVQNNMEYINSDVLPQVLDSCKNMKELVAQVTAYTTTKGKQKFVKINIDDIDTSDKKGMNLYKQCRVFFTADFIK